jgi:hypothetical protein
MLRTKVAGDPPGRIGSIHLVNPPAAPFMSVILPHSVDQNPAPKRFALGSDAYTIIQKALTERLAILEGQKDLAFSTDFAGKA